MSASPKINMFTSPEDQAFDNFSCKCVFLFAGQGSQIVGMGSECVKVSLKARDLYEKASDILGYNLLHKCHKGPKEELDKTEICQPAIFVHSMCAIEKMKETNTYEEATVAAGLSLGEYSALCYAGAISFEDCVLITKERGQAMQQASEIESTGMICVIGLGYQTCMELCDNVFNICGCTMIIANELCEGNYVLSGPIKGIRLVEKIAKPEFKARGTFVLPVAGAFHSEYMAPAQERLNRILDKITINKPRIPVISNVDGKPHSDPKMIRELLKRQITSPVKWEASMKSILEKEDFGNAYELGPGTVLKGIVMKIDKEKSRKVTCVS